MKVVIKRAYALKYLMIDQEAIDVILLLEIISVLTLRPFFIYRVSLKIKGIMPMVFPSYVFIELIISICHRMCNI